MYVDCGGMFCLHADIVFIRIIIFIINYIIILRFNTTGVVLPGGVRSLELGGFWSLVIYVEVCSVYTQTLIL